MSFSFLFILTAGMVAAFNPCGIALLPSYISYLIGGETKDHSFRYAIFKGLGLGGAMTTGFLTIFVLVMGILIALLGLGMLFGKHLPIKIGSFQVKPGKWSIYFYGIAYAVTSLGCTLPAFMLVVSASLNDNSVTAVIIKFIIYSLGMGIVVTAITMVSLISRQLVQKFLHNYMGSIQKIAAVVIFLSGLYMAYYWYFGSGGICTF
ncbi:TPA: cytochrome c biogenesis CcdA family protein [Staphylococcus aureus]